MKRVLIISPHFPPVNAPDMQRIRMSLPYYLQFGWEVEILTVYPEYVEGFIDETLNKTVPEYIKVHKVKALPLKLTRKLGLGALSLRSYFSFKRAGDRLLKEKKFDIIFFSTTMFHVCALGRHWKQKFGVPFIIDFQDPWRNDFYLDKPKQERPPKFKIAYLLNKWMEAYTMPYTSGIISVSKGYIEALHSRYPGLKKVPYSIIPFGCSIRDFEVAEELELSQSGFDKNKINVIYIGAVTPFFIPLIRAFFLAFQQTVINQDDYRFWFIGTNYSTHSQKKMVAELSKDLGIEEMVHEEPNRISYFEAIRTMQMADILFIPGSRDVDYNASKIYNCLLAKRPIFSIFNKQSEVVKVMAKTNSGITVSIKGNETDAELVALIAQNMHAFRTLHMQTPELDHSAIYEYTAEARTMQQVKLFNLAVA